MQPAQRRSAALLMGADRAPARAMLKAVGFSDQDLSRPLVGVANTWIEVMPCNVHLRKLAEHVKEGVCEAVGAHTSGRMTLQDLRELEDHACPGAGACGGQFTANTMATALEFLGISPMGSAGVPATDPGRPEVARAAGRLVMQALASDLRPGRILTRGAFENAIVSVATTGGSTNGVLH